MAKITKAMVEHTEAPASGQRFIRDDELTGFALRITAAGVRSFVWEGRIRGRTRRITLGQFPALTVLEARRRALEIKTAIVQGADPAAARKDARREIAFGELAVAYLEGHAKPHKKSWRRDETRLATHFGHWKARRLSDISRAEVGKLQHAIGQEHGQSESNQAMALLRGVFSWATNQQHFSGANPVLGLTFFKENARRRFLNGEELQRVNAALLEEPDWRVRAYFVCLLLLGLRKSELLAVRWADVDFAARTLAIPRTKSGEPLLLPLPQAVLDLLTELPSRTVCEWVFPGDGKTGHLMDPGSAWDRIRTRAGVPDVRVHDLRHTLASWLVGQGANLPLVGRALNHAQSSTTQRYAHLDLEPVRVALEANSRAMRLGK